VSPSGPGSVAGVADTRESARRSTLARRLTHLRASLPQGRMLPAHLLERRHRMIVAVLVAHVPALLAFGLARGYPLWHVSIDIAPVVMLAGLAMLPRTPLRWRMVAACVGLVTCSAMLVHLWGGVIEAHFHFFVMIGLLTLYQDWLPFLVAIGYVVVHHGVFGVLESHSVYNNPEAVQHPWRWALIHGGFVLAASLTHIASWRTNEQQLLRDPLTGLPSRLLLMNRLQSALARIERTGRGVAVLFIDLDRFKIVNDSLGHIAGDALLRDVARRVRTAIRPGDMAARLGGDEFTILLFDLVHEDDALGVARRIQSELERPFNIEGQDVYTSASIGIAFGHGRNVTTEDILRDADTAMYRAKSRGKARYEVFDAAMHQAAVDRMRIEMDVRRAVDREQLHLVYQPIVTPDGGEIAGIEALLRWTHPQQGLVMPQHFIPIAEENGAIVPMGDWVLSAACEQITRWDRAGLPPVAVNVNISAIQLQQPDIATRVLSILERHNVSPARIRLEVTESVITDSATEAIASLRSIRDLGVQLSVDDFGIGYSSLALLLRLP
jgi:diguanylate cyclase (GGDEF)-like protein